MHIEPDDICYNKAGIIERSLRRMREEYSIDPDLKNYSHVDALILNIERACQAAIDMAMHITAIKHLGIPQNSGEAFSLLGKGGILTKETVNKMVAMTGFRNVAIHEYQALEMKVVHYIAQTGWKALEEFCLEVGLRIKV